MEQSEKVQYVPHYVLNNSYDFKYTPQFIKLLDSDLVVHPAASTRKGMEEKIVLREVVNRHLDPIRKLNVGAPDTNNALEWQQWYKELPNTPIVFDQPDVKLRQRRTQLPSVHNTSFMQDSISGDLYQLENSRVVAYALSRGGVFTTPGRELAPEKRLSKNEIYSKEIHDSVLKRFANEKSAYVYPRHLPVGDMAWVPVLRKIGFQEKLYLYRIDTKTLEVGGGICIYTYLPLDEYYWKTSIDKTCKMKDENHIVLRFGNAIVWMMFTDNELQ